MTFRILLLSALLLPFVYSPRPALAQTQSVSSTLLAADTPPHTSDASAPTASFITLPPSAIPHSRTLHPFSQIGIASQIALSGPGFDIATPLAQRFNLRVGASFFSFASSFQEQGANIAIRLHMQSAHAALDCFPFNGRFRISPLLVFANNNRVLATALIPSGSTITLNGSNYISSYADPLHGAGRIDFRKAAPGFSLGFGNILPRERSRFSLPVELGFYYVGQPGLQVSFTGSACDPSVPPSIGCESVDQDPGFQQNLAAFIARNNHNLSYASFFPIFSVGFAYRLW